MGERERGRKVSERFLGGSLEASGGGAGKTAEEKEREEAEGRSRRGNRWNKPKDQDEPS